MIAGPLSAVRALPTKILNNLAEALRSGRLTDGATVLVIRSAVPGVDDMAATELASLLASGLSHNHAELFVAALVAERESTEAAIELVSSGPDAAGVTRDTGVVLRELFGAAKRRVLIAGFAVYQGRQIFADLAKRMRDRSDLGVRLCLDIRRAPGDTTREDELLRRFADRFQRQEWPGPRLPQIFYDPRSVAEAEMTRASLHAKCVVVDGAKTFIGSANFTEAAQLRNIEIGVVIHRPDIAAAVEHHFEALISQGKLRQLEQSHVGWNR